MQWISDFRFTVSLGALADGTKLPVMVLLPGVRPPKAHDIPPGVIIHMCGPNRSWSNEEIHKIWIARIWGRNRSQRRLMVWDSFKAHITDDNKELMRTEYNSDLAVIPGGCTGNLQPADKSWNKPFKNYLQVSKIIGRI